MLRYTLFLILSSASLVAIGCGPEGRSNACVGEACNTGTCKQGEVRECYTGAKDTAGVGPCVTGEQACTAAGQWGNCEGQVVPTPEVCGDNIDNNCDGAA